MGNVFTCLNSDGGASRPAVPPPRNESMGSQDFSTVCDPQIDLLQWKGMPKVRMTHASGAICEVFLFGATVTKYSLGTGDDVLFLSPHAIFDAKTPIRGGIPIVFPQFGQPNKDMPKHGFARTQEWALDSKQCKIHKDGLVEIVLKLKHSSQTLKLWPFEFELEYNVRLTAHSLTTALTITNPKLVEMSFETLLHTYVQVPSLQTTAVCGLKGCEYFDKTDGMATKEESSAEIQLAGEVDRVYKAGTGGLGVVAAVLVRTENLSVRIEATCSRAASSTWTSATPSPDIVVWNPGKEVAPNDLKEGYLNMVCVEPGLVATPVTSLVQGRMTLTQTIRIDN